MKYQAVMLDMDNCHHRRGEGGTPLQAVTSVFRKMLKLTLPEDQESEADNVRPHDVLSCFAIVAPEDECFESPRTLKETVSDLMVLIRIDRSSEKMYTPCGWVRPVLY